MASQGRRLKRNPALIRNAIQRIIVLQCNQLMNFALLLQISHRSVLSKLFVTAEFRRVGTLTGLGGPKGVSNIYSAYFIHIMPKIGGAKAGSYAYTDGAFVTISGPRSAKLVYIFL